MRPEADGALLERDRELATLDQLLAGVSGGDGRLVLVEGQAGIGKSRLLGELRAHAAAEGLRVLVARGSELEREFPFGVVRQLFEPRLADPAERERLMAGAAAAAEPVFGALGAGEADAAQDASFAALHGLYWLVVNAAAEGPLVLAIDDLHWVDRPSLRFVAYLARRLEGLPVLVVATLRSAEPGTDAALLAEIANDPATVAVQPGALSEAGAAVIVRERLGEGADDAFCRACHESTGGNPLLLRQLLTSLEAEGVDPTAANAGVVRDIGPRAVSRTVLLRLARLPAEATAVAQAVAVLGESADVPAVSQLAELGERAVAEATAALARAEILRPDLPLAFVHALVRDAVYHDLPPGERELQHARAARMLADAGAAPEQIASHLLTVPRRGEAWVVEVLREAGRSALRKGAPESAVAYYDRALEEPPPEDVRPQALLELGGAQMRTNAHESAAHMREAWDLLSDPAQRGTAGVAYVRARVMTGGAPEARAFARAAIESLPPEQRDLREQLEAHELLTAFFGQADEELYARLGHYRTRRPGEGPGGRMLAAIACHDWTITDGRRDECAELALWALQDGVLVTADDGLFPVPAALSLDLAEREESEAVWQAMLSSAHRTGSLFSMLTIHLWYGHAQLRRGDLQDAVESLQDAVAEAKLWGSADGAAGAYPAAWYTQALVEIGDLAAARSALAAGIDPGDTSDGSHLRWRSQLELLLAERRAEDALDGIEEYRRRLARTTNPAWGPWRTLQARALDRLGRTEEGIPPAEEELELARRWGAPAPIGVALRVLGTLRRAEGLAQLEEAVAVLEGSPARLERAKALAAYGSALRRARRPTEARAPLRQSLELAAACGAQALAEEVRSELHATGARPRTEALSGAGALTAKERSVVSLAVEGQTNRDIAQTLYVTPKTVEVHLTNAYRKLGIRSRRELSEALAA